MTVTTFDIHWIRDLMCELGKPDRRPIFHSEADFQHELAWLIREKSETQPRLEYPIGYEKKGKRNTRIYLDIWLPEERIAIELKYRTQKMGKEEVEFKWNDDTFRMKNQGAADIGRYEFLVDVQRLEQWDKSEIGYAVLLTNDPIYWKSPTKDDNVDRDFQLHPGQGEIKGPLAWADGSKTGEGKEDLCLAGPYQVEEQGDTKWTPYYDFTSEKNVEKNGLFQYLAFKVKPQRKGA